MGYSKATRLFQIFCSVFYFRNLSPNKLYALFSALEEESYTAGQPIVHQGEICEKFYIIENGEVSEFLLMIF